MITRRTFLQASASAALMPLRHFVSRPTASAWRATNGNAFDTARSGRSGQIDKPDLQALSLRALDAARSAGARYADVRMTVTERRIIRSDLHEHSTDLAIGVRALTTGSWGFAAATTWTSEIAARLGRQAVEQAKVTVWPNIPPVTLGEQLPAITGHWETPVQRDPFTVSDEEVADFLNHLIATAKSLAPQGLASVGLSFIFERQTRAFASTDGTFVTQTVSTAFSGDPHVGFVEPSYFAVKGAGANGNNYDYYIPRVSPIGGGYEVLEDLRLSERLPEWGETAKHLADAKSFQAIGVHDVVFDADAMAAIISDTCGAALQYDRAIGLEANVGGTSYLAPPSSILGSRWASPAVTITADRTLPRGAATVRWDDDGVSPRPSFLVKDGIIVNYATNREFAGDLAPWYQQQGGSVQPTACAASESAFMLPLVHTPNLILQPGAAGTSFDTLVSGVDKGYVICGGDLEMDMQQRTGRSQMNRRGRVRAYTIKHGKLGTPVRDVLLTVNSPEFWRHVVALGGPETVSTRGLWSSKGQPDQQTMHTVQAVAAHVQNVKLLSL